MSNYYIYLLINKGEIVYVGKSSNVISRLTSHYRQAKKEFDEVRLFTLENSNNVHIAEVYLIGKHNPKYNRDCNTGKVDRNIFDESLLIDMSSKLFGTTLTRKTKTNRVIKIPKYSNFHIEINSIVESIEFIDKMLVNTKNLIKE